MTVSHTGSHCTVHHDCQPACCLLALLHGQLRTVELHPGSTAPASTVWRAQNQGPPFAVAKKVPIDKSSYSATATTCIQLCVVFCSVLQNWETSFDLAKKAYKDEVCDILEAYVPAAKPVGHSSSAHVLPIANLLCEYSCQHNSHLQCS
jgi:hypothetical protein